MPKYPHILNASSNLLGIALVIIVALNASGLAQHVFADEVAWGAAILLCTSCIASYLAMRHPDLETRFERWADRLFLGGLFALFGAVLVLALQMT